MAEQENTKELFKETYLELSKKHKLPEIQQIQEDFEVGKSFDKNNLFFVKDVRRTMGEKIDAYLQFFDSLNNPTNVPPYVFNFLKSLEENKKKEIKEIQKELVKIHIETMKLDTIYDEKKEIEFICSAFEKWQDLKTKIYKIIEIFGEEFKKNTEVKEKSYFG